MKAEETTPREPADEPPRKWRMPLWPWILALILIPVLWDVWPHLVARYKAEKVAAICPVGRSWREAAPELKTVRSVTLGDDNEQHKFINVAPRWSYLARSGARVVSKLGWREKANSFMGWIAQSSGYYVEVDSSGKIIQSRRQ